MLVKVIEKRQVIRLIVVICFENLAAQWRGLRRECKCEKSTQLTYTSVYCRDPWWSQFKNSQHSSCCLSCHVNRLSGGVQVCPPVCNPPHCWNLGSTGMFPVVYTWCLLFDFSILFPLLLFSSIGCRWKRQHIKVSSVTVSGEKLALKVAESVAQLPPAAGFREHKRDLWVALTLWLGASPGMGDY